jgi:hypothetical protein
MNPASKPERSGSVKTRWLVIGAVALVGVAMLAFLLTRPPATDGEQLQRVLSVVADGARRESPNRVISVLSDDYSDDYGNSRASLRMDLMQGFLGPRRFEVYWDYVTIRETDEETLTADVNFEVRQYNNDAFVSTHHGGFSVFCVRDRGKLKVLRVEGLKDLVESVEASYGL